MLVNTFCHIPRVTIRSERRIWEAGLHSWKALTRATELPLTRVSLDAFRCYLDESHHHLRAENPHYFADALPSMLHWRLFPEFREQMAYLDIETTGLTPGWNAITTIALYDGRQVFTYVQGQNLDTFARDVQNYKVLVTYNGKCFDVPFIQRSLGIVLDQVHLDLRYILRSLGYKGGLKGCERQLGIHRPGLEEVDGYFAVLLWQDYKRRKNERALETLLCYNIHDVVNLETLLVKAYNLKIKASPFEQSHLQAMPTAPEIPFAADGETIDRIRYRLAMSL